MEVLFRSSLWQKYAEATHSALRDVDEAIWVCHVPLWVVLVLPVGQVNRPVLEVVTLRHQFTSEASISGQNMHQDCSSKLALHLANPSIL